MNLASIIVSLAIFIHDILLDHTHTHTYHFALLDFELDYNLIFGGGMEG